MSKQLSFRQRLMLMVHRAIGKDQKEWICDSVVDKNAIIKRKAEAFIAKNPPQGRAMFLVG